MKFKKSVEYIYVKSVEVEAESLEEAMDLFDECDEDDWYDEDGGEGEPIYYVGEMDEDGEVDDWEMIE